MQKCMEIDLKNDRALSGFLNLVSLFIAAAMLATAWWDSTPPHSRDRGYVQ